MRRVVFICTGNYYRSRYAEIYFNARVPPESRWRAVSYGFRLSPRNQGPIAGCVLDRTRALGIPVAEPIRPPRQLQPGDLTRADFVVALDEDEHRAYVDQNLPEWAARVAYWRVPDVGGMPIERALATIEAEVEALLGQLADLPGGPGLPRS